MGSTLTQSEEAQLAQTIEMFEVITESQPLDYQSLEILKEAYSKLGRDKDVVKTSKRIAEAYVDMGQLSSAILEYETILQRSPDDPDVQKALKQIESKASNFSEQPAAAQPEPEPVRHAGMEEALAPIPAPSEPRSTVYTEAMDVFHRAADLIGLDRRVRGRFRFMLEPRGCLAVERRGRAVHPADGGQRRPVD